MVFKVLLSKILMIEFGVTERIHHNTKDMNMVELAEYSARRIWTGGIDGV